MASPHLWTPALEPRTIINPWYRHAIINETIALDREEEEYEAQLHSIRIKGKKAPIIGKYKMRQNNSDDESPLIAEDDDDSEYDEGDDDEEEEDDDEEEEEEDLDDDIEELDDEIDDDSAILGEILDTSEELLPTTPPGESSRAMDVSEFEVLGTEGTEEDGQNYEF